MHSVRALISRFALMAAVIAALSLFVAPAVGAANVRAVAETEYDMVYATAHAQMGDQWKFRARGPDKFDCSGLMFFAFDQHGLKLKIGGYRSVSGYYRWFKEQGRVSKTDPQVGDLVVWGNNQHIGLYVGDGMAISTLTTRRGVTLHPVKGYLGVKFKAYLHVDITRP